MQRLVEQPSDNGEVFKGAICLGRVHYRLSVYQRFSETDPASSSGKLDVEGRIAPIDELDLRELHRGASELTLRLADGRALDLFMTDQEGHIRSTGRGLHRV